MNMDDYQKLSARTANKDDDELTNYVLGLAGESGEVADILKKHRFHGHYIWREDIKDELGDVMWYVSQIARVAGISLEEVAEGNIKKLKARYPEGFSEERSRNREEKP